jgi:hypothetical protein
MLQSTDSSNSAWTCSLTEANSLGAGTLRDCLAELGQDNGIGQLPPTRGRTCCHPHERVRV